MNKRKLVISFILLTLFLVSTVIIIFVESGTKDKVLAKGGIIDLRDWDFPTSGTVKLDGEWEFYSNQLLTPDDFSVRDEESSSPSHLADGQIVNIPGKWNSYLHPGGKSNGIGYGTYRLLIKLPQNSEGIYGIKTSNIRMSNKIYMNGQEIGASGMPSARPSEGVQNNVPYVGVAPVKGDSVELIVQVANYSYVTGGIIYSIAFGDQANIIHTQELAILKDALPIAGLLISGIFGLMLFGFRRQEKGLLYLGLFCFASLVFMISQGEKLIVLIQPGIPYWIVLKIQPISSTLVYYFLLRSIAESNPGATSKLATRIAIISTTAILTLFIVMPTTFISRWEFLILFNGFILVGFCLYLMLKGRNQWDKVDFYWLLSAQSIFVIIVIYLLYVSGIWPGLYVITYEMIIFFFAQAVLLAKRFTKSAREVEKLSEKLLTLDGLKDEFMADTSHELRTPLHGMINIAQSMLEGATGSLANEKQAEHLSMIVTTGKQLSLIINDILEFAELRGGALKLDKRAVHLQPVVHAVVEVMGHMITEKEVRLIQRIPATLPLLNTDEDRLRQILYNLLGNAAKATSFGEIIVSARTENGYVTIEVTDTGTGISKELLSMIFPPGHRKLQNRSFKGSGLGLRITRQLIELSGGRLWAESELGKGTTFSFTIPIAEEAKSSVYATTLQETAATAATSDLGFTLEPRPHSVPLPKEFRILVVDDDPVSLQVLIHLLSIEQCEVIPISSATDALEEVMTRGLSYDLVITDWMMPNMSGIELCRKIRERFMLSELPVLLLTAKSRPEDIRIGFEAGVNDYISKPVDAGEMRARVRTLLELRRSVKVAVQSEMAFLQAQIKPHFLYNALNTIIAVCPVNPYKAMDLLIELSQFLRSSFDFHNRDKLTTLEKELELVKSYLTLEQARFEERLKIEFDVKCDLKVLIPPLTIQPIIENAVNHGVMKKEEGGTVRLIIEETGDHTVIKVEDDGVGFTSKRLSEVVSEQGTGRVGLSNIHRRLINLYGSGLKINNGEKQGAAISFQVPKSVSKPIGPSTMGSEHSESDSN
ncbi:hypothetical protein KCTCHS21_04120 [Cohnella abietis]|uniref:histidine kinase n=2 Tax=Cohnella abietis TaxID=2507935 RepID=A0A3T1CYT0_9BACL|nr:hypothetical protein KCTCHS21_04120 [Cohnella abietis]